MTRPTLALALLALAAAAGASDQTVVLLPVQARGSEYHSYYSYPSTHTTSGYTDDLGSAFYFSRSSNETYSETYVRGWLAEFDLSDQPFGYRVVSATLDPRVSGATDPSLTQTIVLFGYAGNGTVPILKPMRSPTSTAGSLATFVAGLGTRPSLDVTTALQTAPGRYIGFDFRTTTNRRYPYSPLFWERPTLTVTYGPAVTIPVTLGDLRSDVTKIPVEVLFRRPGTTEVAFRSVVYPDASGAVVAGTMPGTYDVSLRASHWLRRTFANVTVSAPMALPAVTLGNGDVNGDNVVSAVDRALVTAALGQIVSSSNVNADLNGDGYITAVDRAIVTARLGSVGDN